MTFEEGGKDRKGVMWMMDETPHAESGLDVILSMVEREIREGVKHGFFDYEIKCETINGRKRSLTFKAGKSHRFILSGDLH